MGGRRAMHRADQWGLGIDGAIPAIIVFLMIFMDRYSAILIFKYQDMLVR